ncbi:MAG: ABC transporter ATP-binding protein [Oscillospiraceae bacterium]|nr:ABC transporter ATP-binding protein [Oscillospiraceae bacterium]
MANGRPVGGPRGMRGTRKPKNAGRTIARLLGYMSGKKYMLVLVVIGILLSSLAGVVGTYFLKPVINSIEEGIATGYFDVRAFIMKLAVMAGFYALGVVGSYMYSRLMMNISTETMRRIRVDMFTKLQSLPIRYYDTHAHGEIMSRFTNDTDTLREMLSQGIPQMFSSSVTIIGVFVLMCILSPALTTLIVAMVFVITFVVKKIGGQSAKYFKRQQKAIGSVNGYIEEMIEGQKVVKVFCRENESKEKFALINEELFDAASNANTFASVLGPITNNFSYINYALTATIGAALAVTGVLDIGTVASFLQSTRSFFQPITQISQQFNSIINALAGAERIFELMDEEPEHDSGTVTLVYAKKDAAGNLSETDARTGVWAWKCPQEDGTVTYTEVRGDVRFEDVVFGYDENKVVLDGISLYAKPGQKIAFVGSTGAGKTTITNLINRFYDVPDGKITYDGININKIRKSDLRRSLGMVLQDTHLFTGTVADNIRYGKLDATDEEIIRAAKLANAHSFISHLPEGYDTVLTSDGVNLSQGQRQLIAIARAAVADPPVLILDEATSSIDTRTEALIEKGMDTLMEGRTVFVIAHRLSTVKNSKAIMVLEHGKIIERGTHDDLLEQRGKYYQLYTGMFELE